MIHQIDDIQPFEIVMLPSNLNLPAFMKGFKPKKKFKKEHEKKVIDRAAYLLGQIYNVQQKLGEREVNKTKGWVRLSSQMLQEAIHTYREYRSYLSEGIIEIDLSYSNMKGNSKCMSYRFKDMYRSNNTWKPYVITDSRFVKSISKHRSSKDAKQKYPNLFSCIQNITYDRKVANLILSQLYPSSSQDDYLSKLTQKTILNRIKHSAIGTFKLCDFNNRLYTSVSLLKSELRAALRFKNQPLVEVDIKSSGFWFSLSLFNKTLIDNQKQVRQILVDSCKEDLDLNKTLTEYSDSSKEDYIVEDGSLGVPLFLKSLHTSGNNGNQNLEYSDIEFSGYGLLSSTMLVKKDVLPPDVTLYKRLILEGGLYEYVQSIWNENLKKSYSRDDVKKKLFIIINTPANWKSPERLSLEEAFPNVMSLFETMNKGYTKTKKQGGEVECVTAKYLQRLESWFVLERVCNKIFTERPEVPIFTIHDAILTTPNEVEYLKSVIQDEALSIFDNGIILDTKKYSDQIGSNN